MNKFVTMNIRVTNLSHKTLEGDLRKLFSRYGEVNSASIIRDKNNGRPTGSALIDMVKEKDAHFAIENLNQTIVDGKAITVAEVSF
jgi:RNA recognition motif-containing protein